MSLHRVLTGAPRSTPATYREHIAQFGELPRTLDITKELLSSGLTGHGGAAFPTGKKVELLKNQRHGVQFVVVNAMEGGMALNHCADGHRGCPLANGCPVQSVWVGATRALEQHLSGVRFDSLALGPDGHVVAHQMIHEASRA